MKIKLSSLVLDFGLYPRSQVDDLHVRRLCQALEARATLPPIIADRKSRRVVDGFHRYRAQVKLYGEDATGDVTWRDYASDRELFLDAMRLNAGHGRPMTPFDRAHCLLKADELKIEAAECAAALHITTDALGTLRADRVGTLHVTGPGKASTPLVLKRTIRHMAGKGLSAPQAEANEKLSGQSQKFYANQLIILIESELLDEADAALMGVLAKLYELLDLRLGGSHRRKAM